MFAELSNYLDDELDDSLCEELERAHAKSDTYHQLKTG
jgi:hypothetical protein